MMRKDLLLSCLGVAAVLALSACGGEASDSLTGQSAPSSEETGNASKETDPKADIVSAESGWLTVGADGAVQTTFFDPGGRYRDLRNGEEFAQGKWELRPDGKVCFEPDEGLGACWTTAPLDENGESVATNDGGMAITIKRITYVAPPADDTAGE